MHIAFITPEFPHYQLNKSAGLGTSIFNMAQIMVEKKHDVTVFVYAQKENKVLEYHGIKIHAIAYKKYPFFGWYLHRKYIQDYINNVIIRDDISILEAPDWTGITAFMQFYIPLVIRIHGSDAYFCKLENRKQKKKNYYLEKKALKSANALVSVSQFAANETTAIFRLKQPISIIPNGLNIISFNNSSPNVFNRNTILYFGTIIRKKGVLELAQIFNLVVEKMNEAKLILVGADSNDVVTNEKSTYVLMQHIFTEKAKSKVQFLGKLPYSEINKHIKNAHICIFPSLAESFGMVTIEAMAMQKAVVNSNFGWAKELITHGYDGILENPLDHSKFANQIVALLTNDLKQQQISKNAIETVRTKFDMNKLANQNLSFYESIVKKYKL